MPTKGLILLQFAQHHLLVAGHNAVTDMGKIAAADTDGVYLRDIFGNGAQSRHRPERHTFEIHIEPGNDDALAPIGQSVAYLHQPFVEKLRLVYAYHIGFRGHQQDASTGVDGGRCHGVAVVRNDIFFAVARIKQGFVDFHFLLRNASAVETADEFFSFPGKHTAADHFNAALTGKMFVVRHK